MSRNRPKKSDMGKAWMKPRRDSRQMIAPEYHLIITEGVSTEPQYFRAMKEVIDQKYRDRIHLDISGEGRGTLNLLAKAQKDVASSNNIYKHVWLVYDKDDFPAEHFDRTAELCHAFSTEETNYHAIWSNQCIELWFLLHFMYLQSDLHRDEYWSKLTENLKTRGQGMYYKSRQDMYAVLRPYLDDAIRNAEKLAIVNQNRLPSKAAPGTQVHCLLKMLRAYL